ncbi:MAG: hypothetical protein RIC30_13085 [Marinoscillum sp.]|uniref:hypothetical protein n=1 Tax=Marinoscillum sp. TaxID=2024838 RepID=UPI0032FADE76
MNNHFPFTAKQLIKTTRIEVYHTLTEKFGSLEPQKTADGRAMDFQLDRLLSIVHNN